MKDKKKGVSFCTHSTDETQGFAKIENHSDRLRSEVCLLCHQDCKSQFHTYFPHVYHVYSDIVEPCFVFLSHRILNYRNQVFSCSPGLSVEEISIIDIGPFNMNNTLVGTMEISELLLFIF